MHMCELIILSSSYHRKMISCVIPIYRVVKMLFTLQDIGDILISGAHIVYKTNSFWIISILDK